MTAKKKSRRRIVRVQTGVRMEQRILKVLKGLAECHDMSLGDLAQISHPQNHHCRPQLRGPVTPTGETGLQPSPLHHGPRRCLPGNQLPIRRSLAHS